MERTVLFNHSPSLLLRRRPPPLRFLPRLRRHHRHLRWWLRPRVFPLLRSFPSAQILDPPWLFLGAVGPTIRSASGPGMAFACWMTRSVLKSAPSERRPVSEGGVEKVEGSLGRTVTNRPDVLYHPMVVLIGNSLPALNDVTLMELPDIVAEAAKHCNILRRAAEAGGLLVDAMNNTLDCSREDLSSVPLMVVENGCGSPCIDLRQVSSELAAAAKEADLIVLEGMSRALHTNLNARFKCDALKLAMVKNQRLAKKLFPGKIYDCVCRYEPAA